MSYGHGLVLDNKCSCYNSGVKQARSQDVKFGGAKLFLEGQLSTQTENVNTNTKKN